MVDYFIRPADQTLRVTHLQDVKPVSRSRWPGIVAIPAFQDSFYAARPDLSQSCFNQSSGEDSYHMLEKGIGFQFKAKRSMKAAFFVN